MQPEQSLLLYRCWISRKPAANESKHFLHGEGQRAQLDIKHLTVGQMFQWFVIQPAINEPVTYVIFNASWCIYIYIYICLRVCFSSRFHSRGEGYSLPEYFSEFFELVVRHLSADGFQPFGHKALPQWLTNDIIRYQTQDSVQALLQLGHCGARLVPVSTHLGNSVSVNHQLWCLQPLRFSIIFQSYPCKLSWFGQQTHHHDVKSNFTHSF